MAKAKTKEQLRKNLAAELADNLTSDAFWAADFFRLIKSLQDATDDDGNLDSIEDVTLIYGLLDAVVGDHRAEVEKLVGKKTEDVFPFVMEVLSSSDVTSDDGDTVGE